MRAGVLAVVLLAVLVVAAGASGCGMPPVSATFTSRVVQHEICRSSPGRPELCEQEETVLDLRVRIDERQHRNVWLYGIPRGGVSDRAILGSRDVDGGFLFVDERSQVNRASNCTVTERIELALQIDPEIDPARIGADPCVPLIGRETEVTTSSAGCDNINNPQLEQVLIARRRWEPPPTCTP